MNNSYFSIFNQAKSIFQNDNDLIYFEIMFFLSKNVKNKEQFLKNRNCEIDFSVKKYHKLLSDYFIKHKPLAHITQTASFYGMNFNVHKRMHCPRGETEILCEEAIKILKKDNKLKEVIDICCGTGNIAITIKKNVKETNVSGIDISKNAIKNSKFNAKLNNVEVNFINLSLNSLIKANKKFDCILCNPPYVPNDELNNKMIKFENKISFTPRSKNVMFFYEKIISNIDKLINDLNHYLIGFEFGINQQEKMLEIVKKNNLENYAFWVADYKNINRCVFIYKNI